MSTIDLRKNFLLVLKSGETIEILAQSVSSDFDEYFFRDKQSVVAIIAKKYVKLVCCKERLVIGGKENV